MIGGGVVGAAVAHRLACHGVGAVLLEAQEELARGASGTNSGIVHTGFDSPPGELETRLIIRAAQLREPLLPKLGVPLVRCGARLCPRGQEQARVVAGLAERARRNGVAVELRDDGCLEVPDECVTDPVAYTLALARAAAGGGVELRTGARVEAVERGGDRLSLSFADGDRVGCDVAVNCAGLHADAIARMAGDDSFGIYPRKGEFFVFEPPDGRPLERILLPVPTKRTKGVLAFPTVDGKVIAGPTAHDQEDKSDWTVRAGAADEVLPQARKLLPALEGAEPIASYAGLRPAGRDGANYLIGPSSRCPGLINVAAIRSTGLTASLGIAEHVARLVSEQGVRLGAERALPASPESTPPPPPDERPWWLRAARHQAAAA